MSKTKKGFSLVELSIVILIIGLLIAGVSSGTKLLKQAELRAVIAEMEEIKVAYNTFRGTYDAIPGDMSDASVFFPGCAAGGVGNVNCNGNGDKRITFNMESGSGYDGDQVGDEPSKVFRHLNLAEIYNKGGATVIPNNFSSVGNTALDGFHAKSAAISGAYFVIVGVDGGNTGGSAMAAGTIYHNGVTNLTSNFDQLTNNVFLFEEQDGSASPGGLGKLDALRAFQIDKKIDDGGTSGGSTTGANTGSFRTITDITGANACVTGAAYNITQTAETCVPGMSLE